MALQTTATTSSLPAFFDTLFARIGKALTRYIEARSRHGEIEALEAKSDAELAKLGITRERIVHYVFRDVIGAC